MNCGAKQAAIVRYRDRRNGRSPRKRLRPAPAEFASCALLTTVLASFSCARAPSEAQSRAYQVPQVFTEHRFLRAAPETPKKQLGEDCSTYGASECLSELCFHAGADPSRGHVCSKACNSDEACPEAWTCRSVYPTPGSSFCAPPTEWTPKATRSRPPFDQQKVGRER
jgi:hypothetical protein